MVAFLIPLAMAAASALASKMGGKKVDSGAALKHVASPELDDLQVKLQGYVQAGLMTPEEARTFLQDQSAYSTVQTDPRLAGSQMDALNSYQQIGEAGGLDDIARASLEDAIQKQRTESRGEQEAIMQNARARGLAGSDLELVNRLVAQQGQATRGSNDALQVAALGQQRRDAALANQANLAGDIRNQSFNEQSQKAKAADEINRFNAANRQSVENLNVGARNVAQASNLENTQNILNSQVDARNKTQEFNAQLPLDLYRAKLGQAGAIGQAKIADQKPNAANAEQNAGVAQGLIGSLADLYGKNQAASAGSSAIGNLGMFSSLYSASDERVKEDVQPLDSRKVLEDLTGSTWRYKGDDQTRAGPMAQDYEKSPLRGAVAEAPDGTKMVDYGSMGFESGEQGGMTMALLSDLNKRLSALEDA